MILKVVLLLVLGAILFRMVFKRRRRGDKARFLDIVAGRDDKVRPVAILAGGALLAAAAVIPSIWSSSGAAGRMEFLDALVITVAIGCAAGGVYLLVLTAITAWRRRTRAKG